MKKTALAVFTLLALLTACETMQGLGRDMSKAGNNITDAAHSLTP